MDVLVFTRLMLLLIMEAFPPPTRGPRPRRDLSICHVSIIPDMLLESTETYCMFPPLTPPRD
jgi:hypothetical protein